MADAAVTVLAIVGPAVAGGASGYRLGRSKLGLLAAIVLGVFLALGGLAIWYLDAPTSVTDCYECSEYWGRWMDETMFTVWLPITLALWFSGAVLGALRRTGSSAPPR